LLYSPNDAQRLQRLIHLSAQDANAPPAVLAAQLALLRDMQRYCSAHHCRHRLLSEYFGQPYPTPNCAACDLCLSELEHLQDATVAAQKVLSCVARAGPGFGVRHIADILQGADNARVRSLNHHQLSTFGLLKDLPRREIQHLTHQLIDQGFLDHTGDPYPVLHLNARSWDVMRGKQTVHLLRAKRRLSLRLTSRTPDPDPAHPDLFEALRAVRKQLAQERQVPPFVILHDTTLRELARLTPTTLEQLRQIRGIGERKITDLGPTLLAAIQSHLTNTPPSNP
jgi:ATP-dependent DNA helicase RecQ